MQDLTISLIQSALHWQDAKANKQHFDSLLDPLANKTDLIVLPEMFLSGFSMQPELCAEPYKGPGFQWMQAKAKELNAALVGSIATQLDNGNYANRFYFVSPEGESEFYDKRHLFRMGNEHLHYQAGTERKVINYKGWRICPQICYDLRFPVFSRSHNDVDLMIYVANWPNPRAHAFRTLAQARAIENHCYVAAVNRIGEDGNGYQFQGDSLLSDFNGQLLIDHEPNKAFVETQILSAKALLQFREDFPVWMDADEFKLS